MFVYTHDIYVDVCVFMYLNVYVCVYVYAHTEQAMLKSFLRALQGADHRPSPSSTCFSVTRCLIKW